MKRFFHNNGFLIVVAALLLAGLLAVGASFFGGDILTNVGEIIATPFRNLSSAVADWTKDRYDRAFRYDEMEAEVDALRRRVADLEQAAREGEDAIREVERLQSLLGLAEQRPELVYREGKVTRRASSNWDADLTVNVGTADGVAVNDCVIDQYGNLVGVVAETGLNWARVATIVDPDVEFGARVARTDEDAVLEGDFALMLEGTLRLAYLPVDTLLVSGDQVTTSGLGGIFPEGLMVGTVRSLYTEADGLSRSAVVVPAADLADIRYVYVITDFGGDS